MSQLMSLVEDTMKASKKEEPAGTMEGAADRGDTRESAAAESTNVEGEAPWTGRAQDGRKRSREELVALRTRVSSLTDQMSQLMSLVEDTMKASKKEEPAGTMEGAADRGDARESAAVESTNAKGGEPWTGSVQDGRYLREPVRESGPSGRHSGEAGGFVPQEVRVAAAHNQNYSSAMVVLLLALDTEPQPHRRGTKVCGTLLLRSAGNRKISTNG
ncbi:unnamed protein product [Ectocarpus sp. CCAP 1310/34]|nr:unnamed protein product [Ectocarpus sp. CCAP 1310/34]